MPHCGCSALHICAVFIWCSGRHHSSTSPHEEQQGTQTNAAPLTRLLCRSSRRPLPCCKGKGGAKLLLRGCALPCGPAQDNNSTSWMPLRCRQPRSCSAVAAVHAHTTHLTSTKESSASAWAAKQDAPQPMAEGLTYWRCSCGPVWSELLLLWQAHIPELLWHPLSSDCQVQMISTSSI